jgi:hypothetical protein
MQRSTLDPPAGESPRLVCVVGGWPALPAAPFGAEQRYGAVRVRPWPGLTGLAGVLNRWRPAWLLVGDVPGTAADQLTAILRGLGEAPGRPRFAMLGPQEDASRCRWWVRRGCAVYLARSSSVQRVLSAVHAATVRPASDLPGPGGRLGTGARERAGRLTRALGGASYSMIPGPDVNSWAAVPLQS